MYNPASFRETRPEVLHGLMRARPLGLLVSHGADGLQASPLPFLLAADAGRNGTLRAHLARANPHWKSLDGAECLIVFQGEQGYISPDWYPSKAENHRAVPTWNYIAVEARGIARVIDDGNWLRGQLAALTEAHEGARPAPWAMSEAPADYLEAQMKAVVGLEIAIDRLEGKWKMSQNRPQGDRVGVIAGLSDTADPHANAALAAAVDKALQGR